MPTTEIVTYWHEEGVLLVIPMSATRFRIIADLGLSGGGPPVNPTLDQIHAIIDRRGPGGMTTTNPIWLSAFRINERKVSDYRAGRAFLAGDAAQVHSPAGGQGMNTGMQDAFNLAWKLALVCRREAAEALLDSFSVERSAVGAEVLKAAGRLTMVATMRNHTAQAIRNLCGRLLMGLAVERTVVVPDRNFAHSIYHGFANRDFSGLPESLLSGGKRKLDLEASNDGFWRVRSSR